METIKAFSAANHPNFKNHLIVIPSATKKYISASIPYVFRQNTDFLYFSGCLENDTILALEVTEKGMKSTLFMRPKDRHQELWDGPRTVGFFLTSGCTSVICLFLIGSRKRS